MSMIVDVGYWAYSRGYCIQQALKEGRAMGKFDDIDPLMSPNTILAFDGVGSVRKDHLPWYKANRKKGINEQADELRAIAEQLMIDLMYRYPGQVHKERGLEADDIIGMVAKPGDFVLSNDKDYLQLPKSVILTNLKNDFWGVERFKSPHLNLRRGNASIAFQLLYGDVADNIPRLYYGDKDIIVELFEHKNPLYCAMSLLPDMQQVRTSLSALMLPTPLANVMEMKTDIIDIALERYTV